MKANKLLVLALASIILAGTMIGNASASYWPFEGCMGSHDDGYQAYKFDGMDAEGHLYPLSTDYIGWENYYRNECPYGEYASYGYSCSELSISTSGTWFNAGDEDTITRYGSLAGHSGDFYITSLSHVYYGTTPPRGTANNAKTMQFTEIVW